MAAALMAMAQEPEPEQAWPDSFLTATERYAQIPAIMLVAADQVNYEVGAKQEAAHKYRRILSLFPESKQARVAAERLAQLGPNGKEG